VHGDLKAVMRPPLRLQSSLSCLVIPRQIFSLITLGMQCCVKADIASRTNVIDVAPVAGSRNWMAPEILIGGTLRKFARHLCFWDGYLRGTLSLAE